jgi:hypothetical protein
MRQFNFGSSALGFGSKTLYLSLSEKYGINKKDGAAAMSRMHGEKE